MECKLKWVDRIENEHENDFVQWMKQQKMIAIKIDGNDFELFVEQENEKKTKSTFHCVTQTRVFRSQIEVHIQTISEKKIMQSGYFSFGLKHVKIDCCSVSRKIP